MATVQESFSAQFLQGKLTGRFNSTARRQYLFGGALMATFWFVPSHGTRVSALDQPAYQAFMTLYVGFIAC